MHRQTRKQVRDPGSRCRSGVSTWAAQEGAGGLMKSDGGGGVGHSGVGVLVAT